jgi:hypothetical protein
VYCFFSGNEKVFHGRVDAFLGSKSMIAVVAHQVQDDESTDEEEENFHPSIAIEFKKEVSSNQVGLNTEAQATASCILFGFYQRYNLKDQEPVKGLIPTLVVSRKTFLVILYDSENDILLQNQVVNLYDDEDNMLSVHAVILLWCVLNSHHGHTSYPAILKSGFHDLTSDLNAYKKHLKFAEPIVNDEIPKKKMRLLHQCRFPIKHVDIF